MKILVTGANGFVGKHVCALLREQGHDLRTAVRRPGTGSSEVVVGEINAETDWASALDGMEVVLHLAGRAHVIEDAATDSEAAYWQVNVYGSVRLARQAAAAGVRRLVYVSSIKVSGEQTAGKPFNEVGVPRPEDAYGRSKLAAEKALASVVQETGLELVIVRPVMVVGWGVKGNLALLVKALRRGLPLPFGWVANRRSLVGVRSLAALLLLCAEHPDAAGEIYLAAAPEVLSTPELVRCLAEGLGCRARLWAFPVWGLYALGRLFGKQAQIRRLTTDLEASPAKAMQMLGWQAEGALRNEIHDAAESLCSRRGKDPACT